MLLHIYICAKAPFADLTHPFWIVTLSVPLSRTAFHNFGLMIKNSPLSSAPIWHATKATLRGHIISYCSYMKLVLKANRINLEKEMSGLAQIHKQSTTPANSRALIAVKTELYTHHVHKWFLYTTQKYYEFGNNFSRLLAHQLKNIINDCSINMITSENGDVWSDPLMINTTFQNFYKSLYSVENGDLVSITSYLNNIHLSCYYGGGPLQFRCCIHAWGGLSCNPIYAKWKVS